MERYLKRHAGAEGAARIALDIRLRAERRIGGMLEETVSAGGSIVDRRDNGLPGDVTRDQSSKWQRIASLPDDIFEEELAKPEPSTGSVICESIRPGERLDAEAHMPRLITLLLVMILPVTATAAGQTLCFSLGEPASHVNFKLVISPRCQVAPSGQGPRISSVNGIAIGFVFNQPTEGFLLVGTCEATENFVSLGTLPIGESLELSIFGPSLEAGVAQLAPAPGPVVLEGPVVPVSCGDLEF